MSTSRPGRITDHPTSGKVVHVKKVISLYCLDRDQGLSNKIQTAIGRSKQVNAKGANLRDGPSGQKARRSSIAVGKGDLN